jgi:hypothetical protein
LALGGVAVIAAVAVLATAGASSPSFTARAQSVCEQAQASFKQDTQSSPTSLTAALQIERSLLTTFNSQVTRLSALQPPAAVASTFHAAVADDTALAGMLRSLLASPDYVHLALTLPTHPGQMPSWLRTRIARTHALSSDAQSRFAALKVPACAAGA